MASDTAPSPSAASATAPTPIAWADGRVLPASEVTVPLMDDGFLRGDAVFDAMLVRGGRTHAAGDHLDRLRSSAESIGIEVPDLRGVVADLLAAWGDQDGAIKLILTRDGTVRGIAMPLSWPETMALHVVDIPWRNALSGVKTLSYVVNQWAGREAKAAGCDDALIVSEGLVQELPTGAVVIVQAGRLRTPDHRSQPILRSITVEQVARVRDVEPAALTLGDLADADEAFIVSATRPVLPVHAIGDITYPAPGPVTAEVAEAFDAHIAATLDPLG